ncbi:MAG TPA: FKBP-type peptidyl-prolyl cis-trans isomerase [Acidimicrobiia bacterium]|nr:FKBP-type peptidyl-prolyl cis-trans isomerase [Acidimicrobiia bacterium]
MPVSKQARAAQERQKERVAIERIRRRNALRRRRIIMSVIGLLVIAGLAVAFVAVTKDDNAGSAKTSKNSGPQCIKRVDPLPKGAPDVAVQVGKPPTQLIKKDLKVGTGATVKAGDTVTANYIGVTCTTGKVFDSSYKTGKPVPVSFPLTNVIKGWNTGIPGMKVGGSRLLGIPADQAYGDQAQGDTIPANEPLWFVVQITATKKTPPTTTTSAATATTLP